MLKFFMTPIFLVLILFTGACGRYHTIHIKDFRIYVDTNSPENREAVILLADQYNAEFGEDVLTIVSDPEEANSHIGFQSGLRATENKLGLGQWVTLTTQNRDNFISFDNEIEQKIVYSLEIDFDLENFTEKAVKMDDPTSDEWRHLYHLFCHEIGHGFQMDHDDEITSVMYSSIPDDSRPNVDYETYFHRARSFFQNASH